MQPFIDSIRTTAPWTTATRTTAIRPCGINMNCLSVWADRMMLRYKVWNLDITEALNVEPRLQGYFCDVSLIGGNAENAYQKQAWTQIPPGLVPFKCRGSNTIRNTASINYFHTRLASRDVAGAASLGGLATPHGFSDLWQVSWLHTRRDQARSEIQSQHPVLGRCLVRNIFLDNLDEWMSHRSWEVSILRSDSTYRVCELHNCRHLCEVWCQNPFAKIPSPSLLFETSLFQS